MSVHPNSLANILPYAGHWNSETAPRGRKNAGWSTNEHINAISAAMDAGDLVFDDLKVIARTDPNGNRRAAAVQLIRRCELPDMADFEEMVNGGKTLRELREIGVDTSLVKRIKRKKRTVRRDGQVHEFVENEVQLHDHAGDAFDRVANHTEGLPIQRQVTQSTSLEVKIERKMVSDGELESAYRELTEPAGNPAPADGNGESVHPPTDR